MPNQRPINLDISTIHLPITAIVSILHRVSGVILFFVLILLLWALNISLSSEEGFIQIQTYLHNGIVKSLLWLSLVALSYHMIAGIRHFFMDFGIGEDLSSGILSAKLVILLVIIDAILLAFWFEVWIW